MILTVLTWAIHPSLLTMIWNGLLACGAQKAHLPSRSAKSENGAGPAVRLHLRVPNRSGRAVAGDARHRAGDLAPVRWRRHVHRDGNRSDSGGRVGAHPELRRVGAGLVDAHVLRGREEHDHGAALPGLQRQRRPVQQQPWDVGHAALVELTQPLAVTRGAAEARNGRAADLVEAARRRPRGGAGTVRSATPTSCRSSGRRRRPGS